MSTNYKDRLIRIDDIPQGHTTILKQGSKPFMPLIFVLVIGIVMLLLPNVRIIGIAVVVISGYVLFGAQNRPLFEITDKYIVIYIHGNERECNIIYLDEIINWEFMPGKTTLDAIGLVLNDGSEHSFATVTPNNTVKTMRQLMKDREIIQKKKR